MRVKLNQAPMREEILHFIWEHQYYKIGKAITLGRLPVQVIKPGKPHINAGPDFEQAKINIGAVEWNGDVEIHIKSSDWNAHRHQFDKAYNKVVLHVVWQHDKVVFREDETQLPTLELKNLVDKALLEKVNILLDSITPIACSSQISSVPEIIITGTIQRAFIQRLERKADIITHELSNAKGDWDEVAYRIFMKQMGMKVNSEAFYELSLAIPYSIIRKYAHSLFKIEALLFGVSGMLAASVKDEYMIELEKEYRFLAHKHSLNRIINPVMWKFLRLRPANFPTLRLAQAASILANSNSIFGLFTTKTANLKSIKWETSKYWKAHYKFGEKTIKKVPNLGVGSIDLLLINVVAPILAAYSKSIDNEEFIEKAVKLLARIKPEKNRIIRAWKELLIESKNAGESQGLLELYNESCHQKKCLNCGIGFNLLKE